MKDVRHGLKKLSEYLKSTCPDVSPEISKKVIIAYREYMFDLRQGKNYCDVCYNIISEREASQTKMTDFNYCCDKHKDARNLFQLDIYRSQIGLKVEHLPHLDIYG